MLHLRSERRLLTPVVVTNSSATSGGSVMLSDVELCNKSCCVLLLVDTSATRGGTGVKLLATKQY